MTTSTLVPIARVEQTAVGLKLPDNMTFEEWASVGKELGRVGATVQWAIGDWLLYGEWEFGRLYEQAIEVTGFSYSALADLKYVAGRYDHERRRAALTLQHHREVAPLPTEDADEWLDAAERDGWSSKYLREQVAAKRTTTTTRTKARPLVEEEIVLTLQLSYERAQAWQAAAGDTDLSVWVTAVCDAAA